MGCAGESGCKGTSHPVADPRRWIDREIAGCEFRDARLGDIFRKLVAQIGSAMGQSIPLVCQDWANTKAAYRFLSNDRVNDSDILAGHFQSTRACSPVLRPSPGPCYCLERHLGFELSRKPSPRPHDGSSSVSANHLNRLSHEVGPPLSSTLACRVDCHASLTWNLAQSSARKL